MLGSFSIQCFAASSKIRAAGIIEAKERVLR
jgi:hypothetical protein